MANVSHASLTGSQLHEPKGADTAALGTVYVSNGAGGGSWSSVGTSAFTGMVADFIAPVVPTGWLELDGSTISTSTYSALYGVMALQTSGTRANGSPIITSIASTASFKVGYYVFGTGIASGTTVISIDSGTQVTLSNNASSPGTAAFTVSPWLLNTGTIKLPDVTTSGRYRRSRTSTTTVGQFQADQNQAHTHTATVSGTTDNPGNHTHANSLSDPGHSHNTSPAPSANVVINTGANTGVGFSSGGASTAALTINNANTGVTISNAAAGGHTHTVTGTATVASSGSTETRPTTMIVLTCVKT